MKTSLPFKQFFFQHEREFTNNFQILFQNIKSRIWKAICDDKKFKIVIIASEQDMTHEFILKTIDR